MWWKQQPRQRWKQYWQSKAGQEVKKKVKHSHTLSSVFIAAAKWKWRAEEEKAILIFSKIKLNMRIITGKDMTKTATWMNVLFGHFYDLPL